MPAGLPQTMPGIAEESDGAMQHAPHPARQGIFFMQSLILLMKAVVSHRKHKCHRKRQVVELKK
jgi:hypothetical protein